MANKNATKPPRPPTVDRRTGLKHLVILRRNGESLCTKRPISEEAFYAWRASVATCLNETFGEDNMFMLPVSTETTRRAAGGNEEAELFEVAKLTGEYVGTIIESFAHELEDEPSAKQVALPDMQDVFISHSSEDVELAKAFYELLREALNIEQKRIRCTSVPRLQAGKRYEH